MTEQEVPIVCTLTPAGLVERVTEFEDLFRRALTGLQREPSGLRLLLDADAAREEAVRDLCAREQQCCAFLGFAISRTGAGLLVEITAPPDGAPALDAFQQLATQSAPAAAGAGAG